MEKFLNKYFPKSKTAKGKVAISSFHQFPDESLNEALERLFAFDKCTGSHKLYKTVRIEYRTLRELVLLGKLFQ